jgi:heme oxygenase
VDDLPAAFGSAYVLEGSALGGRQIAKMLEPFSMQERPRRFFTSNGGDISERWKTFRAALEAYAERADADDQIVGGAEKTFISFRAWLA